MTLATTPLQALGVEVADVDLAALLQRSGELTHVVDDVRVLLAEHGVVVLRDQRLDDAAFTALLRAFGELVFTEARRRWRGTPTSTW